MLLSVMRLLILWAVSMASVFISGAIAHAQGEPDAYRLTLSGPSSAGRGDEIAYVLSHQLEEAPPFSTVFFTTPLGTTFVATEGAMGTTLGSANVGDGSVIATDPTFGEKTIGQSNVELIFNPTASTGQITIRVRIDDDARGQIEARANFRVTGLAPSNTVVTSIQGAALPSTGTGDSGRIDSRLVLAVTVGGLVLLLAGAARMARPK